MRSNLKNFYRLFLTFGFNYSIFLKFKNLPRYFNSKRKWIRQGGKIDKEFLILDDFESESGICSGDYFHQDLLVASFIYKNNPRKHIDVGSRIDGFVAHVASFREIEVIDIRPLKINSHENIRFIQNDLMKDNFLNKTDSLSCLHAIEHFGLGRYGDTVDLNGHIKGLKRMISLLEINGIFYISFPIGKKNEVHFNSQRIFNPNYFLNLKIIKENLILKRFDFVDQNGNLKKNQQIKSLRKWDLYGCGIFTFKKIKKY